MGKRASGSLLDGAAAFSKRQKLSHHQAPAGEAVSSCQQLRDLLTFTQDLRRARHGLQSFKILLDNIISGGDAAREANFPILQSYLDEVKPSESGQDAVFLQDIMEIWSFGSQLNDDGVMSSVAVVLALLLHAISESLLLLPHGFGLCQTLLQEKQLKCLSRNLSAERGKAFIISPTLRLLREAVCLDGGAFAKRFVRAKSYTFASLGRNLETGSAIDSERDAGKSTVRANAVRFFLDCLKYLHSEGRRELLMQRELLSHTTYMMKSDPPELVLDIIETLKLHVLKDRQIPRDVKSRAFNTKTLLRFLALCGHTNTAEGFAEGELVSQRAHQFLLDACTSSEAGVLYPYKGIYPRESEGSTPAKSVTNPVFNFVLADFCLKLRPWSSLQHCQLLVAIFTAAPELVADFFHHNRSFPFDPKLTMTWIGYAAFIQSTIKIPFRPCFGDPGRYATSPPPTSILLDNILPPALDQKTLARCLLPNSNLPSFFATRILTSALQKLATALQMLESSPAWKSNPLWSETHRRLIDSFCQRVPDMKEVVRYYKGITSDYPLLKALSSRLLLLYYEVIPRVALAANFDVSSLLTTALERLKREDRQSETRVLCSMDLDNLVTIASLSPGMRWFSSLDSSKGQSSYSAFTSLLRLLCLADQNTASHQLESVLAKVAVESQLICTASGLKPLVRALQITFDQSDAADADSVWSFVNSCAVRCAASPIKYLQLGHEALSQDDKLAGLKPMALINVTMAEQLPYAIKAAKDKSLDPLVRFFSLYFNASSLGKTDDPLLSVLHERVGNMFLSESKKMASLGDEAECLILRSPGLKTDECKPTEEEMQKDKKGTIEARLRETLHKPFPEEGKTGVLTKWASKDADDWIEDGWAFNLIQLLSSEHLHIRKEALTGLVKMAARIKDSTHDEKTQIWLLLSELVESCRKPIDLGPAPSTFTAFSMHALEILKQPLHPLYPKVNSYLTRSPVWPLEKVPLAHDILHGEPSEDDRYYTELAWLLDYLLDCLQTAADVAVFHKKKWFEKILALGSNPYLRPKLRMKILRIIFRVTCIEGGSTTLITRFGVFSWLGAERAARHLDDERDMYQQLMSRLWETCDQERVAAWSGNGIGDALLASG